jgi:hypothetical protein
MNHILFLVMLVASFHIPSSSFAQEPQETKSDAKVFFITPKSGDYVSTKFRVKFGVKGMKIRPAGEDPLDQTSGHHHLIINGDFVPAKMVVPMDKKHIHYGKGQTEDQIVLTPGLHTLTLQFADGSHLSYGEDLSSTIKVIVR